MQKQLFNTIQNDVLNQEICEDRKVVLQPLVFYIQEKVNDKQTINLNFICSHNSRRSHLAQIWAQFAAAYYNIPNINCYSGGTQETALFPKVAETL
ncbi:protein-tyrosine-phosphatase, partial [Empedobacter sp. GD03739]|nr:protein-tyrosine-phosphatase [Empedobacter sp. GD03739]